MSNETDFAGTLPNQACADFFALNPTPLLLFQPEGRLLYWNAAAEGLAKNNGALAVRQIVPLEALALLGRCAVSGSPCTLEAALDSKMFSWSFFPISHLGLVGCSLHEITERVKLEKQLHDAQKSELVGKLSAGVARDFNNVLTVIQGEVGLLRADPDLKPTMEASLRAVSVSTQRACKLLGQLISFNQTGPARLERVDLNETITNLSSILSRGLGEDITFQFHYAPSLPPLHADPRQIEQIVLNLALNARQAMPQGGLIVFQTALVEVDKEGEGSRGTFVCLSCTDTGGGANANFNQSDQPFMRQDAGPSLRLEINERLLKQNGGWMEVRHQPAQGSTVQVYWPPARSAGAKADVVPGGTETLLVVEDEAAVRLTIRNILERFGYQVLEAANGVEALGVWHRYHGQIGLMLTDMVLPSGLSGEELAEKFHSQKPELKIIFTSGYGKGIAGRGPAGLAEGLFLEKPFEADDLLRLVRHALDHEPAQKV